MIGEPLFDDDEYSAPPYISWENFHDTQPRKDGTLFNRTFDTFLNITSLGVRSYDEVSAPIQHEKIHERNGVDWDLPDRQTNEKKYFKTYHGIFPYSQQITKEEFDREVALAIAHPSSSFIPYYIEVKKDNTPPLEKETEYCGATLHLSKEVDITQHYIRDVPSYLQSFAQNLANSCARVVTHTWKKLNAPPPRATPPTK